MTKKKVAIIGTGMSGLTAAHYLGQQYDITLFEKSRGVSGRMSTRYADPYQFDHAAPFFTARSKLFRRFLKPLKDTGVVQEWAPKIKTLELGKKPYKRIWFEKHYVAAPKMNDLCKYLLRDHMIHVGTEIQPLSKYENGWLLQDKKGQAYGAYDIVISTAPAVQAYNLLPENFEDRDEINIVKMVGAHSFMLGFKEQPELNFEAAKVKNNIIEWIFVNSSKPERKTDFSLLVKTNPEWAEKHIDDDMDISEQNISDALMELLNIDVSQADHKALHRWRYAHTEISLDRDYMWDEKLQIGVCGDWCR